MNNILVGVDKPAVQKQITKLHDYLAKANAVSESNAFTEINGARNMLFMAKGIFSVLLDLKLLPNCHALGEDIQRIEAKHEYILEQKRRNFRKWRQP